MYYTMTCKLAGNENALNLLKQSSWFKTSEGLWGNQVVYASLHLLTNTGWTTICLGCNTCSTIQSGSNKKDSISKYMQKAKI